MDVVLAIFSSLSHELVVSNDLNRLPRVCRISRSIQTQLYADSWRPKGVKTGWRMSDLPHVQQYLLTEVREMRCIKLSNSMNFLKFFIKNL